MTGDYTKLTSIRLIFEPKGWVEQVALLILCSIYDCYRICSSRRPDGCPVNIFIITTDIKMVITFNTLKAQPLLLDTTDVGENQAEDSTEDINAASQDE